MSKIVYIIPGFTEHTKQKRYRGILQFFQKSGFKMISVNITWERKVMSDYVQEFLTQYDQHSKNDDVYLFGFSFGAMIAFIASGQLKPKAQFLCSLSPYFQEDLPHIKKWWKNVIGSNRVKDFNTLSFEKLAKQLNCQTLIFAGTEEGSAVARRAKEANEKIKNSQLFMIEGAKHDISQKVYLEKLKETILKTLQQ